MQVSHRRWVQANGDQTLRIDYDIAAGEVVLDVGGYEGQWASDIFGRYLCEVHVFEPVPAFAHNIQRRFARNPHVHVHGHALGSSDGEFSMVVSENASSAFIDDAASVSVPVRAFAGWLAQHQIGGIALMKVNIEGGEYELLDHVIAAGLLPRIRNLQVQFHDFVPQAEERMAAIQQALSRTHRLTYQYPFIWENWARKEATG